MASGDDPIVAAEALVQQGRVFDAAATLARAADSVPDTSEAWARLVSRAAAVWSASGSTNHAHRCAELLRKRRPEHQATLPPVAASPQAAPHLSDATAGPWRIGVQVASSTEVANEWPHRCALCNGPSAGFRDQTFRHSTEFVPFAGWLANAVIRASSGRVARARVWFCAKHLRTMAVAGVAFWTIPFAFAAVTALGRRFDSLLSIPVDAALLAGMYFAYVGRWPLTASQSTARIVTVHGAAPAFVNSLPEAPRELF